MAKLSVRDCGDRVDAKFSCPGVRMTGKNNNVTVIYVPYSELPQNSRGAFGEYRFSLHGNDVSLEVKKAVQNPSIGGWGPARTIIDIRSSLEKAEMADLGRVMRMAEFIMGKLDTGRSPASIIDEINNG